jgi:hypothetical protein
MKRDITPALAALLASNRGPDPRAPDRRGRPDYGVRAALDGEVVELELTFRAGSQYCCMEWGCHLGLWGDRWSRLRLALSEHGVDPPPRLEVRLTVEIEDGAWFFDPFKPDATHPGWFEFRRADAQRYEVTRREDAEPR